MYRLTIENVGKIKSASVQLGGLTVLTGFNDIGKSTIGKVAWSLVATMHDTPRTIKNFSSEWVSIIRAFISNYRNKSFDPASFIYNDNEMLPLLNEIELWATEYKYGDKLIRTETQDHLEQLIYKLVSYIEKNTIKHGSDNQNIGMTLKSCNRILTTILENRKGQIHASLYAETACNFIDKVFHYQQLGTDNSTISMFDNTDIVIKFKFKYTRLGGNLPVFFERNIEHEFYFKDSTFIESPIVLNFRNLFTFRRAYDDTEFALERFGANYPLYLNFFRKLELGRFPNYPTLTDLQRSINIELRKKIAEIINGEWQWSDGDNEFMFTRNGKEYHPFNVASGIRSFGLLQLLADTDFIRPDSLLILDEPESHLHPEWEVKYGELLVWLATQGIPIIVSTHSSYVLQAIRRYAPKYGAEDLIRYYIGEEKEDGSGTIFSDVTDNAAEVFRKNSEAMQKLLFV
jgi:predicted ATPase